MEKKQYKKRKMVGNVCNFKNAKDRTYIKLFAPDELAKANRDAKGNIYLQVSDPRRALDADQLRELTETGKTDLRPAREGAKTRTLYDNILFDVYIEHD